MLGMSTIFEWLTLILLALGGFGLYLLRSATEAAVKTSAEEGAKAALRHLEWPAELARELQKTRGVERQELRFKSYGGLWKELRPLALYDATTIDKQTVANLSTQLSNWYFSEYGGLLLTPQARNFYFALQDLLRTTSTVPEEWVAVRSPASGGTQKDMLRALLIGWQQRPAAAAAADVLDYFSAAVFHDWDTVAPSYGSDWRDGMSEVATHWSELDEQQRFATIQQAGSILRSALANDLESRFR